MVRGALNMVVVVHRLWASTGQARLSSVDCGRCSRSRALVMMVVVMVMTGLGQQSEAADDKKTYWWCCAWW